jgi:transposase
MERSAIHVMAKRGKSIRQIAEEVGHSPTTISRVLQEPLDRSPARRHRRSQVDPYRHQIDQWLEERLPSGFCGRLWSTSRQATDTTASTRYPTLGIFACCAPPRCRSPISART